MLIKTRDPSALKMPGVNIQAIIGEVVTANVPVHRLEDLARLPGVIYIEASRAQQLYNDLGQADAGAHGRRLWRGWVQHVRSGEAVYVQDLRELLGFIERWAGRLRPAGGVGETDVT